MPDSVSRPAWNETGGVNDYQELLGNCRNADKYAFKVTTSALNLDLFSGEVGEPVPEHILDNEVARWYLPEYEADLIEIYT